MSKFRKLVAKIEEIQKSVEVNSRAPVAEEKALEDSKVSLLILCVVISICRRPRHQCS